MFNVKVSKINQLMIKQCKQIKKHSNKFKTLQKKSSFQLNELSYRVSLFSIRVNREEKNGKESTEADSCKS